MHNTDMDAIHLDDSRQQTEGIRNVALGCAALVALLSASCCVIPVGLTVVGLGGAWLSFLGPFAAHRELILIFVSIVVAYLWLRILTHKGATTRRRLGTTMASVALLATVFAWTAPIWEWEVSSVLLHLWANQR